MGKIGKNSFDIQESNRVSVLRILSKEDVLTRADLSRMTGLKQATITNIINDLLSSGVVSETGTLKGNLGRRSIGIRLNAENFNVVGIKIARRSYSVGIFNIKNQLLDKTYQKLEPSTGASAVLQSLVADARRLIDKYGSCGAIFICHFQGAASAAGRRSLPRCGA